MTQESNQCRRSNDAIAQALEDHFRPFGIVAYSMCCRIGCTGSYDEDDSSWEYTHGLKGGITYFSLYLGGMNYNEKPSKVFVSYESLEYIHEHWEEEKQLIDKWCQIVGVTDYEIEKPETRRSTIIVNFAEPLELQPESVVNRDEEDDSEEEEELELDEESSELSSPMIKSAFRGGAAIVQS